MAANSYELGKLFQQFYSQNADEIDSSAGDNFSVELNSQASQKNPTEVLPAATTLKWTSLESMNVP